MYAKQINMGCLNAELVAANLAGMVQMVLWEELKFVRQLSVNSAVIAATPAAERLIPFHDGKGAPGKNEFQYF